MGCGASMDDSDEPTTVVVFGATGFLGGAVARTLLMDPFRFKVKCVTRSLNSDAAQDLAEQGAVIVNANMDEPKTLEKALNGADVMFLTTHYWEDRNKQKEIVRGLNAVDAAVNCGVKHIIFNGSENVKKIIGKECGHLDAKYSIEEYIREVEPLTPQIEEGDNPEEKTPPSINFTILRLPFWYENFTTVFRPHKLKYGVYALALPLEDGVLDAISVEDVGECVYKILRRPKNYFGKTLGLCADRLTMKHIIDTFNKHFDNKTFKDPKVRIKDFENFAFMGAKELSAMFEFYVNGICVRDVNLTKKLYSGVKSFDKWLDDNKDVIEEAIEKAQTEKDQPIVED